MSEETDSAARTIAKGGIIFFIGLLFSNITAYAYRLIIARYLGPGDYGLISLGLAVVSILAGFIGLGLPDGLYRYVSLYKAKGELNKVKGTFFAVFKLIFPLSIIVALLVFFFAPQISIHFFHEPNLAPILRILSVTIPLLFLMTSCLQVARAYKKLQYEVISRNFLENTLKLGLTILFLALGFGIMGAVFAYIAGILAATVAAVYFMQSRVNKLFFSEIKAEYNYKELFKYSLPLLLLAFVSPLQNWLDTIFIGIFMASKDIGIYNAALPTAQMVRIIFPAITALAFPIIIEMLANNKLDDLRNTYKMISRWLFIITLPIAVLFILFSKQILGLLFGSEYVIASTSLIILTTCYFTYTIAGPARMTINALGKTHYTLINYIIAVALNILGNILLIPLLGITGAAISAGVTFAFTNVIAIFEARRFVKINPVSSSWVKPIISAGISLVVFYFLIKYVLGATLVTLISAGAGFFLLYGLLLLAMRAWKPEDVLIWRAMRAKLRR